MSSSADPSSFTIVWEDASEVPTTQELRQGLEKGSDEVKLETLRRIITATLSGSPQVWYPSGTRVNICPRTNCTATNSPNC
jgi:hypothetical protein